MAGPWGGAPGLAGGGEQQHIPTPTSSHPSPVSPTTPGFAFAQRSHTALGRGKAERLQGHPNIFQIRGFRPKLGRHLLQVTQPGADSEPVPGPQGPFHAFIQQPLQAPEGPRGPGRPNERLSGPSLPGSLRGHSPGGGKASPPWALNQGPQDEPPGQRQSCCSQDPS